MLLTKQGLKMNNIYKELFDDYVKELDKAVSFEEDKLDFIREKMLIEGKTEVEIEKFIMGNLPLYAVQVELLQCLGNIG